MKKIYFLLICVAVISCKKDKTTNNSTVKTIIKPDSLVLTSDFKINGAACPYDSKSKTFYFPVSSLNPANNYTLNFDSVKVKALTFNNVSIKSNGSLHTALTVNQQIPIRAVDVNNKTYNYTLVVTGLPIVNLHTTDSTNTDTVIYYRDFELIDPDYKAHNGKWVMNTNSSMRYRGASSFSYPKHSFAVKTLDNTNDEEDESLLGLRTDQNWILDAMYVDQSRMRDRLCTDIWNSYNNVPYIASEPTALNGTRGYLVEVVIDNAYSGVYCLTEKLDRKQIQANKSYGHMYKSDAATYQTAFIATIPYDNSVGTWGGWEFTYPDLGDSPAPDWSHLYNFTNFVSTSTNADFIANIGTWFNLDNAVDYLIAINAFAADDNTAKNVFCSMYNSRTSSQLFFSVWDLDGSFGRDWSGAYYENPDFIAQGPSINNLYARLCSLNPDNFIGKLKARWNALKTNQLSKATINTRITAYENQLILTNAGKREMARWGNITQGFDVEANYMMNWYSNHYDEMDAYINGLPAN